MNRFVSYAQNFEDVVLWRVLGHVRHGFYIDVGAYAPEDDSVTLAFYERGWRGINIEPAAQFHAALVQGRPRDVNLNVAVGATSGSTSMAFLPGTGLSTLDEEQAEKRKLEGRQIERVKVHMATLASIWIEHVPPSQEVHFLKVDVEGLERDVLLGNDWKAHRPWVVVVEATLPNSKRPSYAEWEPILSNAAYQFVYDDGLNRFYLAQEHASLRSGFGHPPNHFDAFVRASEVAALQRASAAEARAMLAEAALAGLENSRSWRITSPLRTLGMAARSARRRAWSGAARLIRRLDRVRTSQNGPSAIDLSPRAQAIYRTLKDRN